MMMRLAQDNSIMDNIDYKAKVPVYARVHPISSLQDYPLAFCG